MTAEEIAAEEVREKEETEKALTLEKEEEAAFDQGFNQTAPTEPKTPPVVNAGTEPNPETKPDSEPEKPPAEPVKPKLAEITEERFKDLLSKAGSIDELKQAVEKRFNDSAGKMGGLERTLKQLQDGTPLGQPVVLTDEDLAEIKEDYPILHEKLVKGFTRIFGKLKGTGPSFKPEEVDERVKPLIETAVKEATQKVRIESRMERLEELHPGWEDIVGPEGSDTEYRKWLQQQTAEYRDKIAASMSPRDVAQSLTKFHEDQKKKKTPPVKAEGNARTQRLAEAAIPSKGLSRPLSPKELSEQDQFDAGFKEGRA